MGHLRVCFFKAYTKLLKDSVHVSSHLWLVQDLLLVFTPKHRRSQLDPAMPGLLDSVWAVSSGVKGLGTGAIAQSRNATCTEPWDPISRLQRPPSARQQLLVKLQKRKLLETHS